MLTSHVLRALESLARGGAVLYQDFNPGVSAKLVRDGLAEIVLRPSPFLTHKGRDIDHLIITKAGLLAIDQQE